MTNDTLESLPMPGWRHKLAAQWMVPLDWVTPRFESNAFGIITYHRVSPAVLKGPSLCVSPARLERQISGLMRLGFQPTSLRGLLELHMAKQPLPRNAFVVCFDDGYAGVHAYALPVLKRLQAPATVFLPTGHLNSHGPRPFDVWGTANPQAPEHAIRILTTRECHELQESGIVELGSHTHQHQMLKSRPLTLRQDLEASVQTLFECFGVSEPLFSYPFGMVDKQMEQAVRESGVVCGLTTECQLVTSADDPFRWGRFGAEQYDTEHTLAAKLNGTYSWVQNAYRRVKKRLVREPRASRRLSGDATCRHAAEVSRLTSEPSKRHGVQ